MTWPSLRSRRPGRDGWEGLLEGYYSTHLPSAVQPTAIPPRRSQNFQGGRAKTALLPAALPCTKRRRPVRARSPRTTDALSQSNFESQVAESRVQHPAKQTHPHRHCVDKHTLKRLDPVHSQTGYGSSSEICSMKTSPSHENLRLCRLGVQSEKEVTNRRRRRRKSTRGL